MTKDNDFTFVMVTKTTRRERPGKHLTHIIILGISMNKKFTSDGAETK